MAILAPKKQASQQSASAAVTTLTRTGKSLQTNSLEADNTFPLERFIKKTGIQQQLAVTRS